jgi:hypothetical protein
MGPPRRVFDQNRALARREARSSHSLVVALDDKNTALVDRSRVHRSGVQLLGWEPLEPWEPFAYSNGC